MARGSLPAKLQVDPRDVLLEKPRFGAFHGTDLELILRSRGVDSVIVTGIATNVCADTTAREACVRDFSVVFSSNGGNLRHGRGAARRVAAGDLRGAGVRSRTC